MTLPAGTRLGQYEITAAIGDVRLALDEIARGSGSRTGKELFYQRGEELIAVDYREEGGRFVASDEKILFKSPALSTFFALVGVGKDGRFLVLNRVGPDPRPGARVVLNWLDELKSTATSRP